MRFSPQARVVASLLLAGSAVAVWLHAASRDRVVEAGFWFEPLTYDSSLLDGPLSREDFATIEAVARAEVLGAFAGVRVRISDRRDARYIVRVMQGVQDLRVRRAWEVAGASRAVPGFGGAGDVSFRLLAGYALSYAPRDAGRREKIVAIGTGIGRAAVHELVHQLLPTAPIHDSTDVRSYEFASAARPEQYFGEVRWDIAQPLLRARFGGAATP